MYGEPTAVGGAAAGESADGGGWGDSIGGVEVEEVAGAEDNAAAEGGIVEGDGCDEPFIF